MGQVCERARAALLAMVLCLAATNAAAIGWDGRFEQLHFSIDWLFVNAGNAVIEASDQGRRNAQFRMEACSNAAIDLVYKVRDEITVKARNTKDGLQSRHFRFRQQEGRHSGDTEVDFRKKGQVRVRNHAKNRQDFIQVPEASLDMVTAFFATRAQELEVGKHIELPVFDKKKAYTLVVEVMRREKLDTILGDDTPTLVIRPRLQSEGVFKRSGDILIWLTDDERHLPVRMESKVRVGKVISNLIEIVEEAPSASQSGLACERASAG